jgi:hypothetical protein
VQLGPGGDVRVKVLSVPGLEGEWRVTASMGNCNWGSSGTGDKPVWKGGEPVASRWTASSLVMAIWKPNFSPSWITGSDVKKRIRETEFLAVVDHRQ